MCRTISCGGYKVEIDPEWNAYRLLDEAIHFASMAHAPGTKGFDSWLDWVLDWLEEGDDA